MKAIWTTYHGPTNSRGSRITAAAEGSRVTVPYDYGAKDPHHTAALALCAKMGWTGDLITGGRPDGKGNVYVFVDDERIENPTKDRTK